MTNEDLARFFMDNPSIASKWDFVRLDRDGKVPSSVLPSYVDDVLEFDTFDDFPAQGEKGKIYLATDTGFTYRWAETQYVQIGGSSELGYFNINSLELTQEQYQDFYDKMVENKILGLNLDGMHLRLTMRQDGEGGALLFVAYINNDGMSPEITNSNMYSIVIADWQTIEAKQLIMAEGEFVNKNYVDTEIANKIGAIDDVLEALNSGSGV